MTTLRPTARAGVVAGGLLVMGLLLRVGQLPAQEREQQVTPPPARLAPGTGGWGAVTAAPRPWTTVVSLTFAFPAGSADDPDDAPGLTWTLGEVIRRATLDRLRADSRSVTELAVEVDRSRTVFRLITLAEHWEEAYGILDRTFSGASLPEWAVTGVRERLAEIYTFERDTPVREYRLELHRMVAGFGTGWSRDPRGTDTTALLATAEELRRHRDRTYRKEDGTVAVVGATSHREVARVVTGGLPPSDPDIRAPDFTPLGNRPPTVSLRERSDRLVITRPVTNTWIGTVYPVDPGTPATSLELLMDRLDRLLNPTPPDPGAFHVDVHVEYLGPRALLVIEAAVLPEAADEWEERIGAAVAEVGGAPMDEAFFRSYLRQFRTRRLIADAAPEEEGLRRALDLMRTGRTRDLPREISSLTADDLRRAAATLGEPRTLVFGPDLSTRDPDAPPFPARP